VSNSFLALLNIFDRPFFSPTAPSKLLISPTNLASNSPTSPAFLVFTSSNTESEKLDILF